MRNERHTGIKQKSAVQCAGVGIASRSAEAMTVGGGCLDGVAGKWKMGEG